MGVQEALNQIETATETAEEIVAATEASTAAIVEAAQERVEEAQETAEAIAAAAIETELGRRIEDAYRRIDEWQGEQSKLKMEVEMTQASLATIQETLNEIRANLSQSTQPKLEVVTETPAVVETATPIPAAAVEPATLPASEVVQEVAQTVPARRIRRLL